jgi:hypothetical protein
MIAFFLWYALSHKIDQPFTACHICSNLLITLQSHSFIITGATNVLLFAVCLGLNYSKTMYFSVSMFES